MAALATVVTRAMSLDGGGDGNGVCPFKAAKQGRRMNEGLFSSVPAELAELS